MSISLEITRIQAARNKIRAKLVELGLVTSTANIDNLATAVDTISDNGNISAKVKGRLTLYPRATTEAAEL